MGYKVLRLGTLSPGREMLVSYQIVVTSEIGETGIISSQGIVSSDDTADIRTDADGDASNGYQPNEVVIGKYPVLTSKLKLNDLNGGDIIAGDTLEYKIKISNQGNAPADELNISKQISANLEYIAGTTELNGNLIADDPGEQSPLINGIDYGIIEANETVTIKYQAKMPAVIEEGTVIENQLEYTAVAKAEDTGDDVDNQLSGMEKSTIHTGAAPGSVRIKGEFSGKVENFPEGWLLEIWSGNNRLGRQELTVQGAFNFRGLSDSRDYLLLLKHPETEVVYYKMEISREDLSEGSVEIFEDLLMDPQGIIYNSITGEPVEGARVTLLNAGGEVVPAEQLGENQQHQLTAADGLYNFDIDFNQAEAGRYRIEVIPPAGYITDFPSQIIEPIREQGSESLYYLNPAADSDRDAVPETDDLFEVVAFEAPVVPDGPTDYYLGFDLGIANPDIINNHIPLDPDSAEIIAVSKTAGKGKAVIGDFVSYQIEVDNNSGQRIDFLTVYDKIPAGFKYLKDSATIKIGNQSRSKLNTQGESLIYWDQLALDDGKRLTITYTLVVGTGVMRGEEYLNKAYVQEGNTRISNIAEEYVLISSDPIFDGSTIIGKVFYDSNANGIQDQGEEGIAQVDILSLNGQKITTDEWGKYHLIVEHGSTLPVGQTMVLKLDKETLPDGSVVISDNPVIIKLSSGLMQKINFAIQLDE